MLQFTVRLDLPFTDQELGDGLVFSQYLPREKEAIEYTANDYKIKMYFGYEKKHLNHVSNDFIKSQKEIKRHVNISTNSLRLKITTDISEELQDSLGKEILNGETEKFCKELMSVALESYNYVFDFTRNILKQSWLQHISYSLDNFGDFFLRTDAVWEYEGQLTRLNLKGLVTTTAVVFNTNQERTYVDRRNWKRLEKFIKKKQKPKTEDVFVANSLEHLESQKTRMAIIEAVIALEHFVKKNDCANVKKFFPKDEFECIKKLFLKKNQFSIPLELIFIKLEKRLTSRDISTDVVMRAVELRNQIMHNSQKEVNYVTARKCVSNIQKLIVCINSLIEKGETTT